MKKILLSVAVLSMGTLALAQGFYTSFNVGYGFGIPGDVQGSNSTTDIVGLTTETNNYGTYGAGINLGLNPGYMFNEHVGVELGLNYLLGSTLVEWDDEDMSSTYTETYLQTSKSNQFRISPAIIVTSGGDKIEVYGKAGLVLPVAGSTVTDVEEVSHMGSGNMLTEELRFESKGALSLGFQGALGLGYKLSEKLSLYGELSHVSLRIKSKSSSMTKYDANGIDVLPLLDTYDTETIFVDELNASSNNGSYNPNPVNAGAAREALASTSNFSALFINIGVKFNF